MQERIKEHDRDIRFALTQTSTVSEHANETSTGIFLFAAILVPRAACPS